MINYYCIENINELTFHATELERDGSDISYNVQCLTQRTGSQRLQPLWAFYSVRPTEYIAAEENEPNNNYPTTALRTASIHEMARLE
jgi:hypothetical protein